MSLSSNNSSKQMALRVRKKTRLRNAAKRFKRGQARRTFPKGISTQPVGDVTRTPIKRVRGTPVNSVPTKRPRDTSTRPVEPVEGIRDIYTDYPIRRPRDPVPTRQPRNTTSPVETVEGSKPITADPGNLIGAPVGPVTKRPRKRTPITTPVPIYKFGTDPNKMYAQ